VLRAEWQSGIPILCIPGVGALEEAAALMLAQLLRRLGIGTRVEHAEALSMTRIAGWDINGIALICLCYVGNPSAAQIRYAIRRIRRRASDTPILVSLLGQTTEGVNEGLSIEDVIIQYSLRATVETIFATARDVSKIAEPAQLAFRPATA
jgi:hypothetical protein